MHNHGAHAVLSTMHTPQARLLMCAIDGVDQDQQVYNLQPSSRAEVWKWGCVGEGFVSVHAGLTG
jgi:hypothetical protein